MSKEINSVKSVLTWRKGSEHPDKSGEYVVFWWAGYNYGVTTMHFSKKHESWNCFDSYSEPSDIIFDEHIIAWASVNEATEKYIVTALGDYSIPCLQEKSIAQDYIESAQKEGRLIS